MQKPTSEQIVTNSPDITAGLKQVNMQKKNTLEKIQEIDGQMKALAKEVTEKVGS